MGIVYSTRIGEIKKNKSLLEKKLGLKLEILGGRVQFDGDSLDEFDALRVFEAINFGFSARKAALLKQEDFVFKKVHIKDYTKRSLKDIRSRLIGTRGKTRKTMSEISGCDILIQDSDVGVLGYVEDVENVLTAVENLIRGSKQGNMYQYLEKMNRLKKRDDFLQ